MKVSVVVPLKRSRAWFFDDFVQPSLAQWGFYELIVIRDEGTAGAKRNKGLARATGDAVLFLDDDMVLAGNAIARMQDAIETTGAAFAFGDYLGVIWPGVPDHPGRRGLRTWIEGPPLALPGARCLTADGSTWTIATAATFEQGSFASSCSLVLRDALPKEGWDEECALDDWDLWIRVTRSGREGVLVPGSPLFMAFYLDEGITHTIDGAAARAYIRKKHGI